MDGPEFSAMALIEPAGCENCRCEVILYTPYVHAVKVVQEKEVDFSLL